MLEEVAKDVAALARALEPRDRLEQRIFEVLQQCLAELNATAAQASREARGGRPVSLRPV